MPAIPTAPTSAPPPPAPYSESANEEMSHPMAPPFAPQGIPPAPQGIPEAFQPPSASPFSNMPSRGISIESSASQDVAPKSYSQVPWIVTWKHCTCRACNRLPGQSGFGCVGTLDSLALVQML